MKDKKDLNNYMAELLKNKGNLSSREMVIFEKLIRLTLEFRDKWLKNKNEILTVGETLKALDIYMAILSGRTPEENIDAKTDKLIGLWLREINNINY